MTIRARSRTGWLVPCALTAMLALVSCADLFDAPIQCMSDSDCTRFSATCDVAQNVCVVRAVAENEEPPPTTPPVTKKDAAADTGPDPARCNVSPKPTAVIGTKAGALPGGGQRGEIDGPTTLECDKDWILDSLVFVETGATLTIEAGTTIRAKGAGAGLVVSPNARLVAEGTKDAPIVFTSSATSPAAGDWRGIMMFGRAPPNGIGPYGGDELFPFSGTVLNDDSGILKFVRMEYAESGLIFGGVGRGTVVDSVEVRRTAEHCFSFDGGNVDVKHLVCQSPSDAQFEFFEGYSGRAQFLFGQKTTAASSVRSSGLLVEDAHPVMYNVTLCGDSPARPSSYGIVFKNDATLDLHGAIVTGWLTGVDALGTVSTPGFIRRSIFFGNSTNPAFVESTAIADQASPQFDDDNGFDEVAWVNLASRLNAVTDPKLVGCFDAKNPKPWPETSLTTNAVTPPKDGFLDSTAVYIGAFKDGTDPWMTGAWVRFSDK